MARRHNRRRQTLVDLDLQMKIVFLALAAAALVLLVNFQMSVASLWSTSAAIANVETVDEVFTHMKARLFREFTISIGVGIPFAAALGILYSFKFCGPLFRIRKQLANLRDGSWRQPCVLRKGDDLKDVARMLNETTGIACEYADDTHDLLQEVRAVLDEIGPVADDVVGARLSRIREGIAREERTYEKHFSLAPPETVEEPGSVTLSVQR